MLTLFFFCCGLMFEIHKKIIHFPCFDYGYTLSICYSFLNFGIEPVHQHASSLTMYCINFEGNIIMHYKEIYIRLLVALDCCCGVYFTLGVHHIWFPKIGVEVLSHNTAIKYCNNNVVSIKKFVANRYIVVNRVLTISQRN